MPKPCVCVTKSPTEMLMHKKGSTARYVRGHKKAAWTFKELVKAGALRASFPLTIR